MNGTSDPNYPEAGNAGAYTGAAREGTASEGTASAYTAGTGAYNAGPSAGSYAAAGSSYSADPNYAASAGEAYTAPGNAYTAPGYVPPPPVYTPPPGYAPPFGAPVPPVPGAPNPGLALVLGFIPGVGAMYNGQFAKGVVHIIIFAILTKVAEHVDIFGIFVAGWIFYMIFDSYQTARARRDGLVPPDPFGLNNVGERFGMPGNPNWGDFMARPPAGTAAADPARTSNPYAGPATDPANGYSYDPAVGAAAGYGYAANAAGTPYAPPVPPASYPPGTMPPPWHPDYPEAVRRQTVADMGAAPNSSYQSTYAPGTPAGMPPMPPQPVSGVPTGAIWLIGLGALALAGTLAHNFNWAGPFLSTVLLVGGGIFFIAGRTFATRHVYPAHTAASQWNAFHQSRLGLVLIVIGILQTLEGLHVARWHYTWPYLLIALGLIQIADRALYNRMLAEPPVFPNAYAPVTPAGAPAAATTDAPSSSAEGEVR